MARTDTCSSSCQLCADGSTGVDCRVGKILQHMQFELGAGESVFEDTLPQGQLSLAEMSTTYSSIDSKKVLREVKVLAELQHPNIVGYHTAWMEHVQPGYLKAEKTLELPYLKMTSEPGSTKDNCSIEEMEESSSIIFADPSESVSRNGEGSKTNMCELSSDSYDSSGTSEAASRLLCVDNPPSSVPRYQEELSQKDLSLQGQCEMEYHLMLHIQMQLCETSLWEWLANRNQRCLRTEEPTDPYQHVDVNWTLKIFQELLEGVYYIHSMGILHRDIKNTQSQHPQQMAIQPLLKNLQRRRLHHSPRQRIPLSNSRD